MDTNDRRRFLKNSIASSIALSFPALAQAPAIITSERLRPQALSGLQIGDVTGDRAMVWSRSDRPARLVVERAFRPDFRDAVRLRGPPRPEHAACLRPDRPLSTVPPLRPAR